MGQGERVKRVWQAFGAAISNEVKQMYTSPKRMILTKDGKVVEAGPGVSGNLIVAAGGQISEDMARKYGLLPSGDNAPKRKPMVAPIIVRGPEGEVALSKNQTGGVKLDENPEQTKEAGKPWEGQNPTEAGDQSLTGHPVIGETVEGAALKVDE